MSHGAMPVPGPTLPIAVAAAVIENLNEWWGQRALAHDPELTFPDIGIRYAQPAATEVDADAIIRTAIRSSPLASFDRASVRVEEEIRIELTASEPQPLSLFRQRIRSLFDVFPNSGEKAFFLVLAAYGFPSVLPRVLLLNFFRALQAGLRRVGGAAGQRQAAADDGRSVDDAHFRRGDMKGPGAPLAIAGGTADDLG